MSPASNVADAIMQLPVWDNHNHLDGSEHLCAQSFWDVGHYFWFCRELETLGYPKEPFELDEQRRAELFMECLDKARNTAWNQMVRQSLHELYGIQLTDVKSLFALDEAIKASAAKPDWAGEVCGRIGLVKLTLQSSYKKNGLELIENLHTYYRIFGLFNNDDIDAVMASADQGQAAEALIATKTAQVKEMFASGIRVFRIGMPFTNEGGSLRDDPSLKATGNSERDVRHHVGHAVMRALDEAGAHIQIFVGMGKTEAFNLGGYRSSMAQDDPKRIFDLVGLFDLYMNTTFEIMNAAAGSSLDILQAARILPNVVPGGLWWFAYRPSVYRANMQYRLEALPACRATFVATDARCIEWAYIKTRLIKKTMSQFLQQQVDQGWVDEEMALYAARSWLHDSSVHYYRPVESAVTSA